MESPIKVVIASLLSGVPNQSISDARKIVQYLRTKIDTRVSLNLDELRERDIAWHTLFSADIYLWNQQKTQQRLTSNKDRWGFRNATRTKSSL